MQKVIQVNVLDKNDDEENKIYELESLINTAGGESVAYISQVISKINPTYYIGKGKVEEIERMAKNLEVDTVIFDVELSASQLRNLEEKMKLHVVDWTSLILDIFAQRANTKEAKLKIKLSQLKYQLPRINKWFSYLSRQSGGIGTRGPGETMLETDKRAIVRDIRFLESQLKKIEKTQKVNRMARKNLRNISLLGYTNAGKSTILNQMLKLYGSNKFVYSDDLLFATLDTSTRRLDFANTKVTLTDTVGFIDNLSEDLNDSFLTTLEEIKFSDMLLIVLDCSNSLENQIKAIDKALKDIDIGKKKILYVFNKIDLVENELLIKGYKRGENKIYISAHNEEDIEKLKERIVEIIKDSYKFVRMHIPFADGNILDFLMTNYDMTKIDYDENGTLLEFEISREDFNKYGRFII